MASSFSGYPTGIGGNGGAGQFSAGMTAAQASMLMQSARMRAMSDIRVRWHTDCNTLSKYLNITIGGHEIGYRLPYNSLESVEFIQSVLRKISYEYGGDVADIVCRKIQQREYEKNLDTQYKKDMEERKRQNEFRIKKDKYNLSSIYCTWMINAIPNIPEELVSALELSEEAIRYQEDIVKYSSAHMQKVRSHYRKYGTLWQKINTYLS